MGRVSEGYRKGIGSLSGLHRRAPDLGCAPLCVLDLSDLPTFSPFNSLSRPHLANDEAHALRHGYVCSESTSASLRPETKQPKTIVERLKRLEVQGVSFTLHLHRKNQEARRQPNRDGLSGQCIIWSFKVHKT